MRRASAMLVVIALLFSAPAAEARQTKAKQITFEAPVPCGAACPHWRSPYHQENMANACEREPLTVPMSWSDVRLKVPAKISGRKPFGLIFELDPLVEYDGFICNVVNPGAASERYRFGTTSANQVTDNCDVLLLGCAERVHFRVKPKQVIVLRAYNWSDGPECKGSYRWVY